MVLQELAIEPFYSVRQVLTRNAGFYPNPRPVAEVLDLIGLSEKADDRIKRLSGGQQRRLDVGLGIIGNPELLFLDEPTTGLDPSGRRETWELIHRLAAGGTTVLLTTHYMDEVEALADHVAVLFDQEIVARGTPDSIGGRDVGAVTIRFRLCRGSEADRSPGSRCPADRRWRMSRSVPRTSCGFCTSSPAGRSSATFPARAVGGAGVARGHLPLADSRVGIGTRPPRLRSARRAGAATPVEAGGGGSGPGDEHRQCTGQRPVPGNRRSAPGGSPALLRAAGVLAQPDRRHF